MIRIDNRIADINHFPDGTLLLKEIVDKSAKEVIIKWNFENNEELVAIYFLSRHIKAAGVRDIILEMPYIPNARQDRVKNEEDVFTLKYFADMINSMEFKEVRVLDAHSNVSLDLIKNVRHYSPKMYIESVIDVLKKTNGAEPLLFYPDAGAGKRYDGMLDKTYCYGVKKRDWETGRIQGLDIEGNTELIEGNDVLIVDDICSYGGTFYHSALKLHEMGARNIFLFVTHCEKSIFNGDLYGCEYVKRIFTTDSIYNEESDSRIEVIRL